MAPAAVLLVVTMLVLASTAGPATAAQPTGHSTLSHSSVQGKQWWITALRLRQAWRITRGKGVTVAVIDTGVDPNFGDLRGALVRGLAANGAHSTVDTDSSLHGTRIADEIAGRGKGFGLLGVAPQARIMPVVAKDTISAYGTAVALNYLAGMAHPPQIVNMSYGAPASCPAAMAAATRRAAARGIVLVAAAGNSGNLGNPSENPANCPGVVSVAAINVSGRRWAGSQHHPYVSIAAPGVHMIGYDAQASSGYGYADGTSDAAAIVSGELALIRAHFPSMSAREVVTRLFATAHQFQGTKGVRNPNTGFGAGLPFYALTAKVPASAPNPVYAALGAGGSSPSPSASGSASGSPSSTPTRSASSPPAAAVSSGGSNTGLVVTIVIVVVVILAGIGVGAVATSQRRRRTSGGLPR